MTVITKRPVLNVQLRQRMTDFKISWIGLIHDVALGNNSRRLILYKNSDMAYTKLEKLLNCFSIYLKLLCIKLSMPMVLNVLISVSSLLINIPIP